MVLRDRTGDDERAMTLEVRGIVPRLHRDPERYQIGGAGGIAIASRHTRAPPMQQLGERTHPGATDPLKVDRPWIGRIEQ
jgi:hypothetical protein